MSDNPYKSPDDRPSPVVFDPHAPPRAKYTLDYPDLHRAARAYMRRHTGIRLLTNVLVIIIPAGLAAILEAALDAAGRASRMVFYVVFCVIALLLVNSRAFFYLYASHILLFIRARHAPGILGAHTIEMRDGELTESTEANRSAWKLSVISRVYQTGNMIIIVFPAGQFLCIPESADFGGDSFDTFYAKLKAAADAAKKASAS